MDLKKFAVRGIIILAVFVALCMFFSGTIRTLTTPKVKLVKAKKGKLEENIEISGKLVFPEVEQVKLDLPDGVTLTIDKVDTRVGFEVEEGDAIITAHVTNYENTLKNTQKTYDQAVEEQMTPEKKSQSIRVSRRDQMYADAYFGLRDARRNTATLKMQMDTLLKQEDKTLDDPDDGYPKKASKELKAAIDAWREARTAEAGAQKTFDASARYSVEDSVWSYITESRACQDKIDEAGEQLRALIALQEQAQGIAVEHDGYIAEVSVKEGDVYDGAHAMYAITPKKAKPVLRADISDLKRTVKKGTEVVMDNGEGETVDAKVSEQGIDDDGKAYVDVEVTKAMIRAKGNLYAMSKEDTPLTLHFKAKDSTILLPVSAVRGSGSDRYVYVTEKSNGSDNALMMTLRKISVKVLSESDDTASLDGDLTNYDVAYMEDRPVEEGTTVMTYLS